MTRINCIHAKAADVPKRLRGWTRNPLGSARAGSSPAVCGFGKGATAGNRTRVESLGGIHHATRPRLLLEVFFCHGLLMSMFQNNLHKLNSDGIEPPLSDLESEVLPLHHESLQQQQQQVVRWPSGLRRYVQVVVSSGAWVRTPPSPTFDVSWLLIRV